MAMRASLGQQIIVANRAPVELEGGGQLRPAAGGLVSALGALPLAPPPRWIGLARTGAERKLAQAGLGLELPGGRLVHFADLAKLAFELHNAHFANPVLWLLQHGLDGAIPHEYLGPALEDSWSQGYLAANKALARVVHIQAEGDSSPVVLIQDYQLMLVPGVLRATLPNAILNHFMHTPWPEPERWTVLPEHVRAALLDSLLANDVLGFQTARDAERFVGTVERFRPGRSTRPQIAVNPISVDAAELRRSSLRHKVRAMRREMEARRPEHLILRVDRADPTKNVLRGFEAYGALLADHPGLHGRVEFWAFVQPSRTQIPLYRRHVDSIRIAASRINARFGTSSWKPLSLSEQDDRDQALAAYALYDTLLVNPIADGMNLVAKEGVVLNERSGALVLSKTAGAHEQLGDWAISIDPQDVAGTADALYSSIVMLREERRRRASTLRRAVELDDLHHWADRLLANLPVSTSAYASVAFRKDIRLPQAQIANRLVALPKGGHL